MAKKGTTFEPQARALLTEKRLAPPSHPEALPEGPLTCGPRSPEGTFQESAQRPEVTLPSIMPVGRARPTRLARHKKPGPPSGQQHPRGGLKRAAAENRQVHKAPTDTPSDGSRRPEDWEAVRGIRRRVAEPRQGLPAPIPPRARRRSGRPTMAPVRVERMAAHERKAAGYLRVSATARFAWPGTSHRWPLACRGARPYSASPDAAAFVQRFIGLGRYLKRAGPAFLAGILTSTRAPARQRRSRTPGPGAARLKELFAMRSA